MYTLKTFILSTFILFCTTIYSQESNTKNDSIQTKKTESKSNFNSRTSLVNKNDKSNKTKSKKTVTNSFLNRKDYLLKKDSIKTKSKVQSNRLYLHKRNISNDSLIRVQRMNKLKKQSKSFNKTDSLKQKSIIKNH